MEHDIISIDDDDILDPVELDLPESKRPLADKIMAASNEQIYLDSMGKKMSKKGYLAQMLWDAVTFGEIVFASGRKMVLDDYDEWLRTVQFLHTHIDGPASRDVSQGVNIYKVYVGVDENLV